jgi:hypothetical protein
MRHFQVDVFEAKGEAAQVAEIKRKHKAASHREFRNTIRMAPKKHGPMLGVLCAPGTPARMIFHDPRWSA